jgi:predicted O-methyltransferase YrrM
MSRAEKLIEAEIQALLAQSGNFSASIAQPAAQYLYNLVVQLKPQLVVEIGCCRGFSTLHLAKGLYANGEGKLVSFDISTGEAARRLNRVGLTSYVDFVQGNSTVEGRRYFSVAEQVIDMLFIDGDHTRRGCMRDAGAFVPLLKVGGLLILHDIYPESCGWLGPRYLLDTFRTHKKTGNVSQFIVEEISSLDRHGIAICRKIANGVSARFSMKASWYATSRLSQFCEIARFERKTNLLQMVSWGISKWRRIGKHW